MTNAHIRNIITPVKKITLQASFIQAYFFADKGAANGLDARERISLLLDCYSGVLSGKQRDSLELYYNEDLSLSEIAEQTGITRQAVSELIKHGTERLEELENLLHVCENGFKMRYAAEQILARSDDPVLVSAARELIGE